MEKKIKKNQNRLFQKHYEQKCLLFDVRLRAPNKPAQKHELQLKPLVCWACVKDELLVFIEQYVKRHVSLDSVRDSFPWTWDRADGKRGERARSWADFITGNMSAFVYVNGNRWNLVQGCV